MFRILGTYNEGGRKLSHKKLVDQMISQGKYKYGQYILEYKQIYTHDEIRKKGARWREKNWADLTLKVQTEIIEDMGILLQNREKIKGIEECFLLLDYVSTFVARSIDVLQKCNGDTEYINEKDLEDGEP